MLIFTSLKYRWVSDEIYTPGSTNIAGWKMDPEWRCISYWKMVIFQPAILVYQEGNAM